jgi:hypothetical protein
MWLCSGVCPTFLFRFFAKELLMDLNWEKIKKGLRDGATMSIEKIEEYTKIGKLKIDELAAKRKMERNFTDIGERSYELIKDSKPAQIADDVAVKKAIANVDVLKDELISIQEKIKQISDEAKAKHRKPDSGDEDITGI